MDWLIFNGKFLGIEWHAWKVVGWLGNVAFFTRFFLQWYASEKHKRVVVPAAFWWLSLTGSMLLLLYALFYQRDSVFIFAYAFTWIPYIRNLVLHRRAEVEKQCGECGLKSANWAKYCADCGSPLADITQQSAKPDSLF